MCKFAPVVPQTRTGQRGIADTLPYRSIRGYLRPSRLPRKTVFLQQPAENSGRGKSSKRTSNEAKNATSRDDERKDEKPTKLGSLIYTLANIDRAYRFVRVLLKSGVFGNLRYNLNPNVAHDCKVAFLMNKDRRVVYDSWIIIAHLCCIPKWQADGPGFRNVTEGSTLSEVFSLLGHEILKVPSYAHLLSDNGHGGTGKLVSFRLMYEHNIVNLGRIRLPGFGVFCGIFFPPAGGHAHRDN